MAKKTSHSKLPASHSQSQATRDGFGEGLLLAARRDPRVIALSADLTESLRMDKFLTEFPDRFIQLGVHEQLLAALAAGLALENKIPFIGSFAVFSPGRNWEQIRTNICLNRANVKIVGSHAGVTVGPDGATHQMLEDIALMRALPRMTVIAPADAEEARRATLAAAEWDGPVYLRLGRSKVAPVTDSEKPFKIGQADTLRPGKDVAIVACGLMVGEALKAAEMLAAQKISAQVINLHTIKPLDAKTLLAAAKKCGAVVTAEEHQLAGGLGSAVAELLAEKLPVPIEMVGVRDAYGQSGEAEELLAHYGLTAKEIAKAAKKALSRK